MAGENFNRAVDANLQDNREVNPLKFGSPTHNYGDRVIDLNEQLIRNKPDTFFMQVNSNAMMDAGIKAGDMVIVDRSLPPKNGDIIIAVVKGELIIRQLEIKEDRQLLLPANKHFVPLHISFVDLGVWGVVTYLVRSF